MRCVVKISLRRRQRQKRVQTIVRSVSTSLKNSQVDLETTIKKDTKGFVTEQQIRVNNAKQYLTLKEADWIVKTFS